MVHVQGDGVAFYYHGNQIDLVQSPIDSRTKALRQYFDICVIGNTEFVLPILTDLKIVVFVDWLSRGIMDSVYDAEHESARVALDNLHLHLKGEVAKIGVLIETVVAILSIWCNCMVGPAYEGTVSIYVPILTFTVVTQRVRES